MEIPYNALDKILGKNDSKDTTSGSRTDSLEKDATVDSKTDSAVQHEQVNKTHEEKVQDVVEKEIHQDHYHTTVQPLEDREVLPEEHKYKEAATQERNFDREDAGKTRAKLEAEQAQFRDTRTEGTTVNSKTKEATVSGDEHVHHHLHETIQPVIEKETVKPSVTHTKVPIHEIHQEPSEVHGTSTAEPMSVDEFKKAGNTVHSSN